MTYQSHADVGGRDGCGPVEPERAQPFESLWEREAFALMFAAACVGGWSVDYARSVIETLPDYDALSYYARWVTALERLSVEAGLLAPEELAAGQVLLAVPVTSRALRADQVSATLMTRPSVERDARTAARYAVGDRVRTRSHRVDWHTRLPAYASGKGGVIERVQGVYVFPDTHAPGRGEDPQWLYTVVFTGRELWGASGSDRLSVSIDAWEPYLERLE